MRRSEVNIENEKASYQGDGCYVIGLSGDRIIAARSMYLGIPADLDSASEWNIHAVPSGCQNPLSDGKSFRLNALYSEHQTLSILLGRYGQSAFIEHAIRENPALHAVFGNTDGWNSALFLSALAEKVEKRMTECYALAAEAVGSSAVIFPYEKKDGSFSLLPVSRFSGNHDGFVYIDAGSGIPRDKMQTELEKEFRKACSILGGYRFGIDSFILQNDLSWKRHEYSSEKSVAEGKEFYDSNEKVISRRYPAFRSLTPETVKSDKTAAAAALRALYSFIRPGSMLEYGTAEKYRDEIYFSGGKNGETYRNLADAAFISFGCREGIAQTKLLDEVRCGTFCSPIKNRSVQEMGR